MDQLPRSIGSTCHKSFECITSQSHTTRHTRGMFIYLGLAGLAAEEPVQVGALLMRAALYVCIKHVYTCVDQSPIDCINIGWIDRPSLCARHPLRAWTPPRHIQINRAQASKNPRRVVRRGLDPWTMTAAPSSLGAYTQESSRAGYTHIPSRRCGTGSTWS